MQHYYTKDPSTPYEEFQIQYNLKDHLFRFTTASGVFSKKEVDYGSQVLIKAVLHDVDTSGPLLDLGCGYGVIGITLATFLQCETTMVDINQRAVDLANKNAAQLRDVNAIQGDGFEHIPETTRYQLIVSNPPIRAGKDIYYRWFEQAKRHLVDEGAFYCVIRKKQGAPSAKKELNRIFGNCDVIQRDAGYYILRAVHYEDAL